MIRKWSVEFEGKQIGTLLNGRMAGMSFWELYDVVPEPGFSEFILNPTNWHQFRIRDPSTGEVSQDAILSADVSEELSNSQIGLRGLYTDSDIETNSQSVLEKLRSNVVVSFYILVALLLVVVAIYFRAMF